MNHGTDVELFFIFRGGEVEVWMFKGIGVKYSFQHFYLDPDGDLYVVEIRQYGAPHRRPGLEDDTNTSSKDLWFEHINYVTYMHFAEPRLNKSARCEKYGFSISRFSTFVLYKGMSIK